MNKFLPKSATSAASARRGAAFLLLVVMVLLVTMSATQWLLTRSLANRKGEINRLRARSMVAAMNQAQALGSDRQATLRLPVDDASDQRIEVVASSDGATLTAIWLRGNSELARVVRPLEAQPSSTHSADQQNQESGKQ